MREFVIGAGVGGLVAALVAYAAWPEPRSSSAPVRISSADARPPNPTLESLGPSSAAVVVGTSSAAVPTPPAAMQPAAVPVPTPPPPQGASPAVPGVALSAEHASILSPGGQRRPPTLPDLHEEFIRQQKDPVGSLPLEESIRQAIAAANTTGEFEVMSIDCRASLCEILAFGNLPSSGDKWNRTFGDMTRQAWFADNIRSESTSTPVSNNRYVIATILQRKK